MEESKRNIKSSILADSLLNGVAGCFGVACQTLGLLWHFNLAQEKVKTGKGGMEAVMQMTRAGGVLRLYQGFFSACRSASMARFGDNFFNSLISRKIEKNQYLKNTSIPILFGAKNTMQSAVKMTRE